MKYQILRGILIAGVVVGFGSGFAQVGAHWAMHRSGQHPHWSKHCRDKDRDQTTPEAKIEVKPEARREVKPDAKPATIAPTGAKIDARPAATATRLVPPLAPAATTAPLAL